VYDDEQVRQVRDYFAGRKPYDRYRGTPVTATA